MEEERATGAEELPVEILSDICSRLPVKSLFRCRAVSRLWCGVVDDPYLAAMHQERSHEDPEILLLDRPTTGVSAGNFLRSGLGPVAGLTGSKIFSMESACRGLFCFVRRHADEVVVLFNPLRQEATALPPPPPPPESGKRCYGLGFDPRSKSYKTVRVVVGAGFRAHVHTLGTDSWREVPKGPPCALVEKPIYARGALHWRGAAAGRIVRFDVGKEEFDLVGCPCDGFSFHLVALRGSLALVDCSLRDRVEIWVLNDSKWVKEHAIGIKAPPEDSDNAKVQVMGTWKDGHILFRHVDSYFSFDPRTGMMKYINVSLDPETELHCHKGSLVSFSKFVAAQPGPH